MSSKVGWSIDEWCQDSGLGRSTTYILLKRGEITSAKVGARRVITTNPAEYLASKAVEVPVDAAS